MTRASAHLTVTDLCIGQKQARRCRRDRGVRVDEETANQKVFTGKASRRKVFTGKREGKYYMRKGRRVYI